MYTLYSNRTATRLQHCTALNSRRRYLLPYSAATLAKAPKGSPLRALNGINTSSPFSLSISIVMWIVGTQQLLRKSSSLLGRPTFFFEPRHTSSKDTSCLRCFHRSLCTATLQQHCTPLTTGRTYLVPCRTAALANDSCGLSPICSEWKKQKIPFSLDCLCQAERWQPSQ